MVDASQPLTLKQTWRQKLEYLIDKLPPRQVIMIVGIGHPLKSDDYVGSLIAKDLMQKGDGGRVIVVDAEHSLENVLGKLEANRPGLLILIDSLDLGAAPGTIAMFDLDLLSDSFFTTHNIPLRLVLGALTSAPKTVILGVQSGKLEVGGRLSVEVKHARTTLVKEIGGMVERLKGEPDAP